MVQVRYIVHDVPVHYACELGAVHLAIHPDQGWPGARDVKPANPVIVLDTKDASAAAGRLATAGIEHQGPFDRGFGWVVSLRDPDGNHIELLQSRTD